MSEKMIFCLGEGKEESKGNGYQKNYMVFNKKVTEKEYDEIISSLLGSIKITATHWVEEDDMTDDEKENHDVYKQLGGYLKYISYEDMWSNWWKEASKKEKNLILDLDQFDGDIFKGITGIDASKEYKQDKELAKKKEQLIKKANELLKQAEQL